MKRTNIYLDEAQVVALDEISRARGVSRAQLIRQFVDSAIGESQNADLAADLAAITGSFGVLRGEDDIFLRGQDGRDQHLDRIARL